MGTFMTWVKAKEKLPNNDGIFKVKLKNEEVVICYFHKDRFGWLNFYGVKTSYWQRKDNYEFLFDEDLEWWKKDEE
jgi:hypothetical protein